MKITKPASTIAKNVFLTLLEEIEKHLPSDPYIKSSLFFCKVAVASFFDLYPDEGKKFWNLLKQHIPQLTEEMLSSQEFQQSLAITFEALLRTREVKKRKLIQQIYLNGYISAEDRQEMNLERFYRVAQEISLEALEYLKFIAEVIIPRIEKWAKEEVEKMIKENRDKDDAWWIKSYIERKSISEAIMEWIYEEYDPNSKIVKNRIPNIEKDKSLMEKQWKEEKMKQKQYEEMSSELLSLGIFRIYVKSVNGFGGGTASGEHTLTDFGYRFIDFVKALSLVED